MKFDIRPYEGVGPLSFGDSVDSVRASLGDPRREGSLAGRWQLTYPLLKARFSSQQGGLIEASFLPAADVTWNGNHVFSNPTFHALLVADGDPQECVGFVVLLELGLAVTGIHDNDPGQRALTVFARGTWDHLRKEMRPFRPMSNIAT
jgi:hypothetical protein